MRGKPVVFDVFGGGIDTDEYQAGGVGFTDNQPRLALNVVSTAEGALRSRDGVQHVTAAVLSMGAAIEIAPYRDASNLVVVREASTRKVYATSIVFGGPTLLGTLPSAGQWNWVGAKAPALGPLFGSNGTDTRIADTVTITGWVASSGTLHPCKYLVYAGNRMWMTGDPSNPYRVYFSDLADVTSWPAANVFDLDPEDGMVTTGIAAVGPYVIVAKQRKLWAIYDLDTGANRKISGNIGTAAHRTMKETAAGLMFLTPNKGIYVTDGSSVKPVTKHWRPPNVDQSTAHAGYWDDRYFLAYSVNGTGPDRTVEWDLQLDALWDHDYAAQQYVTFSPGNTTEAMYAAGSVSGNGAVLKMFTPGVTADAGSAFTSRWRGSWWEFGQPALRKRCRMARFDGSGTISTVGVAKDYDASIVTVGSGLVMQSSGTTAPAQIPTLGVARAWSLDLQSTLPFELRSITMAMQSRAD